MQHTFDRYQKFVIAVLAFLQFTIVLDFMMPILDGPGMLRAMHEDPHYEDVPVILMSGVASGITTDAGMPSRPHSATAAIAVHRACVRSFIDDRFGMYSRMSPFVFSLLPRCHGLCGSQK